MDIDSVAFIGYKELFLAAVGLIQLLGIFIVQSLWASQNHIRNWLRDLEHRNQETNNRFAQYAPRTEMQQQIDSIEDKLEKATQRIEDRVDSRFSEINDRLIEINKVLRDEAQQQKEAHDLLVQAEKARRDEELRLRRERHK